MSFEFWGFNQAAFLSPPAGLFGYIFVLLYASVGLLALFRGLGSLGRLKAGQWLALFVLRAAGVLAAQLFILRFPARILPPPGIPLESRRPGLALFVLLPAFLAGGWLGVLPAMLVGFATGVSRAGWETFSWFTPFEYMFVAGAVAWLVRQDYRGWPLAVIRHPAAAGLAVGLLAWPLLFLSYLFYSPTIGLPGWDYVSSLTNAAYPVFLAEAGMAGLLAEFARVGVPAWWGTPRRLRPPFYSSSLNSKLFFGLIPIGIFGIAVLLWATIHLATDVATGLMVDQMAGVADTAGRGIPFFIQTGQNLVASLASQRDLLTAAHQTQVTTLSTNLRVVPFFRQLTLYGANLEPMAGYPADSADLPALRASEKQLLGLAQSGIPQNAVIYPADPAGPVDVVFVVPVRNAAGQIAGVMLGRADLATNPLMQSATSGLSGLANGLGQGFILDDQGVIIYHPNPAERLSTFQPEPSAARLDTRLAGAQAYQDQAPDGTRRLVLYYPVPGHPWSVVVMVPNYVVLALAAQISTNLVLLLLGVGLAGLFVIFLIAGRVIQPATMLSQAAERIAEGHLDQPVVVTGEDEIGRASLAFERMRQKLRARLDELSLLLRVSQGVAGSLNLDDSLPPILEAALAASGATGVRIVLVANEDPTALEGAANQRYPAGAAADLMELLDRGVLQLMRDEPYVVLDNLMRARTVLDVALVGSRLQALGAWSLRQENHFYGALWLAYDQPHTFTDTEKDFLATLAGQAALAVANARLYEAADQGRSRLASILASTADAVVVTDRAGRLLLLNPAAEAAFELAGQSVIGRPVGQVLRNPDLAKLLLDRPAAAGAPPTSTGEFEIAGRTLFASASNIISDDGSVVGRVCLLRDVTRFKELDQMKSEFVATVSHDLRAPLTFIRGYATMLPMVGALNEKQREFGDKIIGGVEQMTVLIDNLLDLGRIEAGVGLAREPVRMNIIIAEVVNSLLPIAANKGLRLEVDLPPAMLALSGDATLLRQAVANLVDNAIKYTPGGGEVRLHASLEGGQFQFDVTDSGLGIAPADQTRLFERFFRVQQRGSSLVKGSGLGLAIVKSIAERHGGRVWVDSKLGKGSTFGFAIPASPGLNSDAKVEDGSPGSSTN